MKNDNFRQITPYIPGAQPRFEDMIKLNTNENPYPPAPEVKAASRSFDIDLLRLYPPVDGGELRDAIASYHGVDRERVFVGVGSDDVLAVIFQACFNSGEPVLFPAISYSFYEVWGELYNLSYIQVPLREDFTIDPERYMQPNGGIVIANPNAPTGIAMSFCDIERIVAGNPDRVVVIDEAYIDFGGESVLPLTDKYDNLMVVRTFSKSRSMAGIRIGYCVASPELISRLEAVKNSTNSYTMDWPAVMIGKAALVNETYFKETVSRIVATRQRLVKELEKLGFTVLPSSANFVFATHAVKPASVIFNELQKRHIFVRHFSRTLIENYLRITVGTDEQTDKLISELGNIILNRF